MRTLIILLLISVNGLGQFTGSDSLQKQYVNILDYGPPLSDKKVDQALKDALAQVENAPLIDTMGIDWYSGDSTGIFFRTGEILRSDDFIFNHQPHDPGHYFYLHHDHKWVELHQDTVEVEEGDWDPLYGPGPTYNHIRDEYEQHIPLICLICHEEKKKVIHYKREP